MIIREGVAWTPRPPGDASGMTEQRYSIPVDELVASARVPASEQVESQPLPQQPAGEGWAGVPPYADGMSGDVDGD